MKVADFRNDVFDVFREQAVKNKRMMTEDVEVNNEQLMDDLNLLLNRYLTRAAILLFHQKPEKWIPGSFVKIAYFSSDADIEYQNEVHGPLIAQAELVVNLIFLKYLKATISYNGITRVESYPYPRAAIREAVLNAIAHKDYSTLTPVQIRIYDDKIMIANDCVFPTDWTAESLMEPHKDNPMRKFDDEENKYLSNWTLLD